MAFGESNVQRQARLDRQRKAYPELEGSDYDTIGKVDALRRSEGRPLTTFGKAVEDTYIGIQQEQYNPDTPDTAPNVEGWTPQPLGLNGIMSSVDEMRAGFADAARIRGGGAPQPEAPAFRGVDTLPNIGRRALSTVGEIAKPLVGWGNLDPSLRAHELGGTYTGSGESREDADRAMRQQLIEAAMQSNLPSGLKVLRGPAAAADQALNPANLRAAAPETFQRGRGTLDDAGRLRAAAGRAEDFTPRRALAGAGDTPPSDAVQALRDALDAEVGLRKSGVVAGEISAGRSRQAARIAGNIEGMQGASLQDRIVAASRGAKTGQLRETFQQPLELSEAHVTALADQLQDALKGSQFEQLTGFKALDALIKGENVQPAQLKLLQRVFGEDIGALLANANKGRVSPRAVLDAAAEGRVAQAAKFSEKQIAQLEERALAQFKHADELAQELAMNPTNSRLKRAVQQARQAGEYAQTRADELLTKRTQSLSGIPDDPIEALAQQKSTYRAVETLRKAELAQRSGKALTEEQTALLRAKEVVGRKLAIGSSQAKGVMGVVDELVRGNRVILDAIQNDRPFLSGMQAVITGDLPDSFLSTALQRRSLARSVLERQGVQPSIASKMAGVLFDDELARHYPAGVPDSAKAMLQKATRAGALDDGMPEGLELLVQRAKNTMFGLGDVGVLGVQGLNAVRRGSVPLLMGSINRGLAALHLPHVATIAADSDIDRLTQFAIDGLHMGTGPSSARPDTGTMLSYLGKVGRGVDEKYLNRAIDAMNEVQFGKVLGTMRNLDHEGNLAMLKLLGRDITNPRVRAQAAENANTLTSFARSALNANRRSAEGIALTSPSMTRARVNSILQMAKLITPKASVEQRIMAGSMIFSTYVVYTTVGKWLNDQIGIGEFVADPSAKGYGLIKSRFTNSQGQNILIDIVPQDSVERAFAQSIRTVADPDIDDIEVQRAWEKVLIGSGSIATRGGLALGTRTGFEPGKGYRFGNLSGRGMIQSLIPAPPTVQNIGEGASPLELGLGVAGVGAYPDDAPSRGRSRGLPRPPQPRVPKPRLPQSVR